MGAGRRTGSPGELSRCNGVVGAVRRAAAVATIAITGCAGWVEADDPWFDAPSAELSPAIVYGYGAPLPPDEPAPVDVASRPDDDDPPDPTTVTASFAGRRHLVIRCRLTATVEVVPSLAASEIRRTVQRHENDIRVCYNHALQRDPVAAGRVSMQFLIAVDGTVPVAFVESSAIDDWRLHECISATIRRWTFPVPPGVRPSVVRYPYVFSATRARR
jgi:hypothetical protein